MNPEKTTKTTPVRERNPDDEPALTDLNKLVPVSLIRETQNTFSSALGAPIAFVSPNGEIISVPQVEAAFCWQLHRDGVPQAACMKCERSQHLLELGLSAPFKCALGLSDIVVPIRSGKLLFGYLISAQTSEAAVDANHGSETATSEEDADGNCQEQSMQTLAALVTELAVTARQNQLSSIHDPITGLANRAHFWNRVFDELEISKANDNPLSLLLISLDNFQDINITYGHAAGDRVLWLVGQVLRREVRVSDLAAQYGNGSFMVLLRGTDAACADTVSWRLRSRIGVCKMSVSKKAIQVSATIGSVTYPDTAARDPDDLYKAAYQSLCESSALPKPDQIDSAA